MISDLKMCIPWLIADLRVHNQESAISRGISKKKVVKKINFELTGAMIFFRAEQTLDEFFGGETRLEETHALVKSALFS